MSRTDYEARTEALIMPILADHDFELVDVEYVKEGGNWYLRAYIDKEGGITVDDCELVSRALEEKLDREDFIRESYILEVSSPGLGRPLKKDKDFKRSQGKDVEIHLYRPFEHEKNWEGRLEDWDLDSVTIVTEEGREIRFQRADLALIREAVHF